MPAKTPVTRHNTPYTMIDTESTNQAKAQLYIGLRKITTKQINKSVVYTRIKSAVSQLIATVGKLVKDPPCLKKSPWQTRQDVKWNAGYSGALSVTESS